MNPKILLFDADGVLTLPEEVFSVMYAKSRGLDPEVFEEFFRNDWRPIVTGQKDLRDSIEQNPDLWQWDGTTDELLQYWFETEDMRNESLIELIGELKDRGYACYLATDQEKYRGAYMKNVMFAGLFEGYFISSDLRLTKSEPKFFEVVYEKLAKQHAQLKPQEIMFFDDSQSKVDAANAIGMKGVLYTGIDTVKQSLGL